MLKQKLISNKNFVEPHYKGRKKVWRVAKGKIEGEDVYLALGKTDAGRHLSIFFILKKGQKALPISARDIDTHTKDQIPEHFKSAEEAGEFWDAQSAADYLSEMEEVEMEFDIQRRTFLV
ncbi:MAG: hypothetical protein ABIJ28_03845, partial [Patescibacteria group bacterium]